MNIEKMLYANNYTFEKIIVPFECINNIIYTINNRKDFYVAQLSIDIDGNIQEIIDKIDKYLHDTNKNWDCFEFIFITDKIYNDKYHSYTVEFQGMRISRIVEINHENKTIIYKNYLVFQTLFSKKFLKNIKNYLEYKHIKKN